MCLSSCFLPRGSRFCSRLAFRFCSTEEILCRIKRGFVWFSEWIGVLIWGLPHEPFFSLTSNEPKYRKRRTDWSSLSVPLTDDSLSLFESPLLCLPILVSLLFNSNREKNSRQMISWTSRSICSSSNSSDSHRLHTHLLLLPFIFPASRPTQYQPRIKLTINCQ